MCSHLKYSNALMGTARMWALESYCTKRKVGAVVEKQGRIYTGFNGTPSGTPNVCEHPDTQKTYPWVIHAEANAIAKCSPETLQDATLWCTCAPCIECAELIVRSKIKIVVYDEEFKNNDGLDLLINNGVEVIKFSTIENKV